MSFLHLTCMTALKKHVFPKLFIPLTGTDAPFAELFPFNISLPSLFSSWSRIIFDDEPINRTID